MRRREFLRTTGLATVALGHVPSTEAMPANLSDARSLTIATPWPQGTKGYSDLAYSFSRRLELAFGGHIRFDLATQPEDSVTLLDSKVADLHIGFMHEIVERDPAAACFAGLPGHLGMDTVSFQGWLAHEGYTLWDEFAAAHGLKQFAICHTGSCSSLWSKQPLSTLAGLKADATGLTRDVIKGLGGISAVPNDRASIDVTEVRHSIEVLDQSLSETMKHCIVPGITAQGSTIALSMRLELWGRLSSFERGAILKAASESFTKSSRELQANEPAMRRAFASASNVKFRTTSPAIATEFSRVAEAVVAEIAARTKLARKINASFMAFKAGEHISVSPLNSV